MLIDNGIKNTDINGGNIIIQNDGSIKVIDYGEAYEISKLSGSKKQNLIIKMAKYAKPHDDSEKYNDEMSKRLESKLTKLKQGRGKTKRKVGRKARRKTRRKPKRKTKRNTKQRKTIYISNNISQIILIKY